MSTESTVQLSSVNPQRRKAIAHHSVAHIMAANGKVSGTGTPEVDKEYLAAVEGAKKEVETLLEQTRCVPLFLRLAYHDAMTYDATTKTGGANGSIRVQRELDHAGNESLSSALDLLEPIKAHYQVLTYAGM